MAVAKSVYIPQAGDYLTDGTRMVEVLGKVREGFRVIDVLEPTDHLTAPTELLTTAQVVSDWRRVVGGDAA